MMVQPDTSKLLCQSVTVNDHDDRLGYSILIDSIQSNPYHDAIDSRI